MKPSVLTVEQHQQAFDYFNKRLFSGKLPDCMITLSSHGKKPSYFRQKYFKETEGNKTLDEIGMNPEHYEELPLYLSHLVRGMVHLHQHHFGKPGKRGWHNIEWSKHMLDLGLEPFCPNKPDKMVGVTVDHRILPGGPFDHATRTLLDRGFGLRWLHEQVTEQQLSPEEIELKIMEEREQEDRAIKRKRSKTKFFCSNCEGVIAWANYTTALRCGQCGELMQNQANLEHAVESQQVQQKWKDKRVEDVMENIRSLTAQDPAQEPEKGPQGGGWAGSEWPLPEDEPGDEPPVEAGWQGEGEESGAPASETGPSTTPPDSGQADDAKTRHDDLPFPVEESDLLPTEAQAQAAEGEVTAIAQSDSTTPPEAEEKD